MVKRRILDYGFAGLLLLSAAALFHANLKRPSDLNGFDQAVLRISAPLQAAATWLVSSIGGVWNAYIWLVDVAEENRELRRENRRLRYELTQARRRVAEADVIEQLAALRSRMSADTVGARVIAAQMTPYYRVSRIRIDRGQAEVAVGMPVVDERGLVGRISRVYGDYADVLLVSDPGSSIEVFVQRTGSNGSLRGLGHNDSYTCEIEMLERGKDPVQVGDLVVTSGLGEFPPGLKVGRIEKIKTKDYGMFQEVEVEPVADLSSLRNVIVLLAPPPEPDPDAGQQRWSERAFETTPY